MKAKLKYSIENRLEPAEVKSISLAESLFSPNLKTNHHRRLEFKEEAAFYVSRALSRRSPLRRRLTREFSKEIVSKTEGSPLVFVGVPIHVSESDLDRCLESYAENKRFLRKTCFVYFINGRGTPGVHKNLESKIRFLKEKYPNSIFFEFLSKTSMTMGTIRGILADAIVLAALEMKLRDPIVITNDADTISVSKDYLKRMWMTFYNDGLLDFCVGKIFHGYSPFLSEKQFSTKLPDLYLQGQFLNEVVSPGGANMAFRLSAYCAAGGYPSDAVKCEDMRLFLHGRAMRTRSRESLPLFGRHQRFLDEVHVTVSPRRLLWTILKGQHVLDSSVVARFGTHHQTEQSLVDGYLCDDRRLQLRDVLQAMKGSKRSTDKIRRHVEFALVKPFTRANLSEYPELVSRFSKMFGVNLDRQLRLNLKDSPILKDLYTWAETS